MVTSSIKEIIKEDQTSYIIKVDQVDGIEKLLPENSEVVDDFTIKVCCDVDMLQTVLARLLKGKYKILEMKENVLSLEEAFLKKAGGNIIG